MPEAFQERFCRHFHVPPECYAPVAFSCALYPHARLLRFFLLLANRDFFEADREFVASVGRLTRRRDFSIEMRDFQYHPQNRGFLRSTLRLRVSSQRMARLFYEVWSDSPDDLPPLDPSLTPFTPKPTPPTSTTSEQT